MLKWLPHRRAGGGRPRPRGRELPLLAALQEEPRGSAPPFVFWLSPPRLLTWRLNTPRKRERLTRQALGRYAAALRGSGLLAPDGGPCLDVDLGPLSEGCGAGCTEDGMHYRDETYSAGAQVMLNAMCFVQRRRRSPAPQ